MTSALRTWWYRYRATLHREWGSYLAMALLIGLIGGLAIGSVAAARRTQSSFDALVNSTHPSQIDLATAIANPAIGNGHGYNAALTRRIAELPHVTAVASAPGINAEPLGPHGDPVAPVGYPVSAGTSLGSLGGEYSRVDRLAISAGRPADPARADEFVTSPTIAAAFGFHVGEVIPMGFYTNSQTNLPGFGTGAVQPHRRIDMHLVGLGLPVTAVVADDVDAGGSLGYFTPALTRQLLACCVNYTNTAIRVDRASHVGEVEAALGRDGATPGAFETTAEGSEGKANRAIKPLAIALGVFGAVAALAALLIAGQLMARHMRRRAPDRDILRALGADEPTLVADTVIGVLGAVAIGSLLASGVAVALSPLSPLGPVRPFYPTRGISFDWTVLAGGFGALFIGISLVASVLAVRSSPRRLARRQRFAFMPRLRSNRLLDLPAPASVGIRFALQPAEVDAVPMRSVIVGAALAVTMLTITVTFGASLSHLISTPRLYGWNWSYALAGGGGGGGGDIPAQKASALLAHDRYLARWSGVYFDDLTVDGQDVPVIATDPGASVQPPLLYGHSLQHPNEVVLGALTLASLHKQLGAMVTVSSGTGKPHRLRIVGVATMPTIGSTGGLHTEMGTGAVVASSLIPGTQRNPFNDPETGPYAYFVDVRPGVNPLAARRSLQAMTRPLSNSYNFGVIVQTVLHPAEIVGYRSMGTTPTILAVTLGVGVVAALGLTLLASVRRRRRALALLKTLGFTRSQLTAVVAWQSNAAVVIGTIVGVPLGVAIGRALWDLFARQINAVPSPAVPAVPIAIIALGALLLANVLAVVPGRIAARTPAAVLLRAE